MLALHRIALPERVGIDWSFGGWREHLRDIREGHTDWEIDQLFLELVRFHDSFASNDSIPGGCATCLPCGGPPFATKTGQG
jgi:hypothetical protein